MGAAGQARGKPAPPGKVRLSVASSHTSRMASYCPAPFTPITTTAVGIHGERGVSKAPCQTVAHTSSLNLSLVTVLGSSY